MRRSVGRCCLGLALIAAGLGLAFSALQSSWRSQAAEVRAAFAKELDGLDLGQTADLSTQVGALLEAALACEEQDQGLSPGLSLLHGSRVTYVRGALSSPDVAEVVYFREPGEPSTVGEALAALTTATQAVDRMIDGIEDWEAIGRSRYQADPPPGSEQEWDRYTALNSLMGQLQHRSTVMALEGKTALAWREVEHQLCVAMLLSEARFLINYLISLAHFERVAEATLDLLADGQIPDRAMCDRLLKGLRVLEQATQPTNAILGEAASIEERIRNEPAEAMAYALGERGLLAGLRKPEVTLKARFETVARLEPWMIDLLKRWKSLLEVSRLPPPRRYVEAERLVDEPTTPLADAYANHTHKAIAKGINTLAILRCSRIALLISQQRDPGLIEDPWAPEGAPMRWEQREDGRLWIWSVGIDQVNNNATPPEHVYGAELDLPLLSADPYDPEDTDLIRALPLKAK